MRLLRAAYVVYLLALGLVVLTPGGGPPGLAMRLTLDLVDALGLEASSSQLEVALNVVLFVPLGLLGWFALRPRLVFWVAAGAALSVAIELAQLAIPDRVSTVSDVVANTAGSALGAVLALGLTAWGKRGR